MSGQMDERRDARSGMRRLGGRTIGAIVIAVVILLFVVLNRDRTKISFIVFSTKTDLWVALLLAAVAGMIAGFLLGRRHYRR